jgi:hypothetical protein
VFFVWAFSDPGCVRVRVGVALSMCRWCVQLSERRVGYRHQPHLPRHWCAVFSSSLRQRVCECGLCRPTETVDACTQARYRCLRTTGRSSTFSRSVQSVNNKTQDGCLYALNSSLLADACARCLRLSSCTARVAVAAQGSRLLSRIHALCPPLVRSATFQAVVSCQLCFSHFSSVRCAPARAV